MKTNLAEKIEKSSKAKPLLKCVGGKTSSLPFLEKFLPEKIGTYYEPMVGGGALFFHLANEKRFSNAWINDANPEFMNAYVVVQKDVEALIKQLKKMRYSETDFYKQRAKLPRTLDSVKRAARTIYLNKTCFNGLYRVNQDGHFNVPFGRYDNPTICDEDNLRACSELLQDVRITCMDYCKCFPKVIGKNEVVYFDPPYVPVSKTGDFTSYVPGGWDREEHERLASIYCSVARTTAKATFLLSNSDTPLVRKLYQGMKIVKTEVRRSVNSDPDKRGKVGEVLIIGRKK